MDMAIEGKLGEVGHESNSQNPRGEEPYGPGNARHIVAGWSLSCQGWARVFQYGASFSVGTVGTRGYLANVNVR